MLLSGLVAGHGLYVAPHTLSLVLPQVPLTPYLLLGAGLVRPSGDAGCADRALQRVADQVRVHPLGLGAVEGHQSWPFGRTAFSGVSITASLTLADNFAAILYRDHWIP